MVLKEGKINFVRIAIAVIVGVSLVLILLVTTRYLPDSICENKGFTSSLFSPSTPFACPFGCVIEEPSYNCPQDIICSIQKPHCKGW